MPEAFAAVAPGVKPGAPFELPYHRGEGTVRVGWAVLPPHAPYTFRGPGRVLVSAG
jgi:hypothetical protein